MLGLEVEFYHALDFSEPSSLVANPALGVGKLGCSSVEVTRTGLGLFTCGTYSRHWDQLFGTWLGGSR